MTHDELKQNKTQTNNIHSNNNDDEFPKAPDGGWGWMVVFGCFFIHIITDGITYSFGEMYVEFLNEFNEGKGYTSWILSLMCGTMLCSGPISSSFVNKYGCRVVAIAGSILTSVCLFASYYATNVLTLIVTIGFGVGCGFGMIYLPAIVSVSIYFEKYRSIAIGIAVAGSGLGTFMFAPLMAICIQKLGWRNTILVLSIIVLMCAAFGSLFRPLKPSTRKIPDEPFDRKEQNYEIEIIQSNGQNGFKKKPTHLIDLSHIQKINIPNVIPEEVQIYRSQSVGNRVTLKQANANGTANDTRSFFSESLLNNISFGKKSESRSLGDIYRHSSGTLARLDIFYQGPLSNIPHYRSQSELTADIENCLHRRINDNEQSFGDVCCGCIPAGSHETILEMLNVDLLTDPIFVIFAVANFLTSLGFYVPYFCLSDKTKMLQLSREDSSYLLAIIGFANTIGRIVLGYVTLKPWVNRLYIYISCLLICGFASASSIFCLDFESLAVYAIVFGLSIGALVGLTSVILVDLLGIERLTNAFGLLLLFQGIGSFIGPPIAGWMFDQTQSYTASFLFAGISMVLSGFILYLSIPILQRRNTTADQNQKPNALKQETNNEKV